MSNPFDDPNFGGPAPAPAVAVTNPFDDPNFGEGLADRAARAATQLLPTGARLAGVMGATAAGLQFIPGAGTLTGGALLAAEAGLGILGGAVAEAPAQMMEKGLGQREDYSLGEAGVNIGTAGLGPLAGRAGTLGLAALGIVPATSTATRLGVTAAVRGLEGGVISSAQGVGIRGVRGDEQSFDSFLSDFSGGAIFGSILGTGFSELSRLGKLAKLREAAPHLGFKGDVNNLDELEAFWRDKLNWRAKQKPEAPYVDPVPELPPPEPTTEAEAAAPITQVPAIIPQTPSAYPVVPYIRPRPSVGTVLPTGPVIVPPEQSTAPVVKDSVTTAGEPTKEDYEIAAEPVASIVARTRGDPQKEMPVAVARRVAAAKKIASTLKAGDTLVGDDGTRREIEDILKNGDIYFKGDSDYTKDSWSMLMADTARDSSGKEVHIPPHTIERKGEGALTTKPTVGSESAGVPPIPKALPQDTAYLYSQTMPDGRSVDYYQTDRTPANPRGRTVDNEQLAREGYDVTNLKPSVVIPEVVSSEPVRGSQTANEPIEAQVVPNRLALMPAGETKVATVTEPELSIKIPGDDIRPVGHLPLPHTVETTYIDTAGSYHDTFNAIAGGIAESDDASKGKSRRLLVVHDNQTGTTHAFKIYNNGHGVVKVANGVLNGKVTQALIAEALGINHSTFRQYISNPKKHTSAEAVQARKAWAARGELVKPDAVLHVLLGEKLADGVTERYTPLAALQAKEVADEKDAAEAMALASNGVKQIFYGPSGELMSKGIRPVFDHYLFDTPDQFSQLYREDKRSTGKHVVRKFVPLIDRIDRVENDEGETPADTASRLEQEDADRLAQEKEAARVSGDEDRVESLADYPDPTEEHDDGGATDEGDQEMVLADENIPAGVDAETALTTAIGDGSGSPTSALADLADGQPNYSPKELEGIRAYLKFRDEPVWDLLRNGSIAGVPRNKDKLWAKVEDGLTEAMAGVLSRMRGTDVEPSPEEVYLFYKNWVGKMQFSLNTPSARAVDLLPELGDTLVRNGKSYKIVGWSHPPHYAAVDRLLEMGFAPKLDDWLATVVGPEGEFRMSVDSDTILIKSSASVKETSNKNAASVARLDKFISDTEAVLASLEFSLKTSWNRIQTLKDTLTAVKRSAEAVPELTPVDKLNTIAEAKFLIGRATALRDAAKDSLARMSLKPKWISGGISLGDRAITVGPTLATHTFTHFDPLYPNHAAQSWNPVTGALTFQPVLETSSVAASFNFWSAMEKLDYDVGQVPPKPADPLKGAPAFFARAETIRANAQKVVDEIRVLMPNSAVTQVVGALWDLPETVKEAMKAQGIGTQTSTGVWESIFSAGPKDTMAARSAKAKVDALEARVNDLAEIVGTRTRHTPSEYPKEAAYELVSAIHWQLNGAKRDVANEQLNAALGTDQLKTTAWTRALHDIYVQHRGTLGFDELRGLVEELRAASKVADSAQRASLIARLSGKVFTETINNPLYRGDKTAEEERSLIASSDHPEQTAAVIGFNNQTREPIDRIPILARKGQAVTPEILQLIERTGIERIQVSDSASDGTDPSRVEGFVHEGRVYILAHNLDTADDIRRVFMHEQVGHIGINRLMAGSNPVVWAALKQALKEYQGGAIWKAVAAKYAGESEADIAREVMAKLSEDTPKHRGLWARIIDFIRTWLAKLGLTKWGPKEIEALIRRSGDLFFKGTGDMWEQVNPGSKIQYAKAHILKKLGFGIGPQNWADFFEKKVDWTEAVKGEHAEPNGRYTGDPGDGKIVKAARDMVVALTDSATWRSRFVFKPDEAYKARQTELLKAQARDGNYQAAEAVRLLKQDPEAAWEQATEQVTQNRSDALGEWDSYLTYNPVQQNNPFWKAWVWTSLLNLRPNVEDMPPALNPGVLAEVYNRWSTQPMAGNFGDKYAQISAELAARDGKTFIEGGNRWVYIPGQMIKPDQFDESVAQLTNLSRENWCTRRGMAPNYLRDSSFWVMVQGGRPAAVFRVEDHKSGKPVVEIQGRQNLGGGYIPPEHAAEIEALAVSQGYDLKVYGDKIARAKEKAAEIERIRTLPLAERVTSLGLLEILGMSDFLEFRSEGDHAGLPEARIFYPPSEETQELYFSPEEIKDLMHRATEITQRQNTWDRELVAVGPNYLPNLRVAGMIVKTEGQPATIPNLRRVQDEVIVNPGANLTTPELINISGRVTVINAVFDAPKLQALKTLDVKKLGRLDLRISDYTAKATAGVNLPSLQTINGNLEVENTLVRLPKLLATDGSVRLHANGHLVAPELQSLMNGHGTLDLLGASMFLATGRAQRQSIHAPKLFELHQLFVDETSEAFLPDWAVEDLSQISFQGDLYHYLDRLPEERATLKLGLGKIILSNRSSVDVKNHPLAKAGFIQFADEHGNIVGEKPETKLMPAKVAGMEVSAFSKLMTSTPAQLRERWKVPVTFEDGVRPIVPVMQALADDAALAPEMRAVAGALARLPMADQVTIRVGSALEGKFAFLAEQENGTSFEGGAHYSYENRQIIMNPRALADHYFNNRMQFARMLIHEQWHHYNVMASRVYLSKEAYLRQFAKDPRKIAMIHRIASSVAPLDKLFHRIKLQVTQKELNNTYGLTDLLEFWSEAGSNSRGFWELLRKIEIPSGEGGLPGGGNAHPIVKGDAGELLHAWELGVIESYLEPKQKHYFSGNVVPMTLVGILHATKAVTAHPDIEGLFVGEGLFGPTGNTLWQTINRNGAEGVPANQALAAILARGTDAGHNPMLTLLADLPTNGRVNIAPAGPEQEAIMVSKGNRPAYYDAFANKIYLSKVLLQTKGWGYQSDTIAHELTHHHTVASVELAGKYDSSRSREDHVARYYRPEQKEALRKAFEAGDKIIEQWRRLRVELGADTMSPKELAQWGLEPFDNPHEFVVALGTDQKFQHMLGGLKAPVSAPVPKYNYNLSELDDEQLAALLVQGVSKYNLSEWDDAVISISDSFAQMFGKWGKRTMNDEDAELYWESEVPVGLKNLREVVDATMALRNNFSNDELNNMGAAPWGPLFAPPTPEESAAKDGEFRYMMEMNFAAVNSVIDLYERMLKTDADAAEIEFRDYLVKQLGMRDIYASRERYELEIHRMPRPIDINPTLQLGGSGNREIVSPVDRAKMLDRVYLLINKANNKMVTTYGNLSDKIIKDRADMIEEQERAARYETALQDAVEVNTDVLKTLRSSARDMRKALALATAVETPASEYTSVLRNVLKLNPNQPIPDEQLAALKAVVNDSQHDLRLVNALTAAAKLDIDWELDKTPEILTKLVDSKALTADPQGLAAVAGLIYYGRKNPHIMTALAIKTMAPGMAKTAAINAIKEIITGSKKTMDELVAEMAEARKTTGNVARAKAQYRARQIKALRKQRAVEVNTARTQAMEKAMPKLAQQLTIWRKQKGIRLPFEYRDGIIIYNPPSKTSTPEEVLAAGKPLVSTEAGFTTKVMQTLINGIAWVQANPDIQHDLLFQIQDQNEVLTQLFQNQKILTMQTWRFREFLEPDANLAMSSGLPMGRRLAVRMRDHMAKRMQGNAKGLQGIEVGTAITAFQKASGLDYDTMKTVFFTPAMSFIEHQNSLVYKIADPEQALAKMKIELRAKFLRAPATAVVAKSERVYDLLWDLLIKNDRAGASVSKTAEEWGVLVRDTRSEVRDPRTGIMRPVYRPGLAQGVMTGQRNARRVGEIVQLLNDVTSNGRKVWLEALTTFQDEATRGKVPDAATLKLMLTPEVMSLFVEPFINHSGYIHFPAPKLSEDMDTFLAQPAFIQQAWSEANGDWDAFVVRLFQLELTPDIPPELAQKILPAYQEAMTAILLRKYKQTKSLFDESQESSKLGLETVPHQIMDARMASDLPPEFVDYILYDQHTLTAAYMNLAAHSAFGRNLGLRPDKNTERDGFYGELDQLNAQIKKELAAIDLEYSKARLANPLANKKALDKSVEAVVGKERMKQAVRFRTALVDLVRLDNNVRSLFMAPGGFSKDARLGLELISTMVGGMLQRVSSSIYQLSQLFEPFVKQRMSKQGAALVGSNLKGFLHTGAGSFTQSILGRLANVDKYDRLIHTLKLLRDPANESTWRTIMADPGRNNAYSKDVQGRMIGLLRKARGTLFGLGLKGPKGGRIFPAIRPLAPFSTTAAILNWTSVKSYLLSFDGWIDGGMTFFLAGRMETDFKDPAFQFTAKDLGMSQAAFDEIVAKFRRLGTSLEAEVRRAMLDKNGSTGGTNLTPSLARRIAALAMDELSIEAGQTNTPSGLKNSAAGRIASPLLTWPLGKFNSLWGSAGTPDGEASWASARSFWAAMLLGMVPGGLIIALLADQWDKKALRKQSNLGEFTTDTDNPNFANQNAVAAIERLSRVGTFGLGGDIINGLRVAGTDGDLRGVSFDGRVVFASTMLSLFRTASNVVHQRGTLTYSSFYRPMLQTVGGGWILQNEQILNTLAVAAGGEPVFANEDAFTQRINVSNILRAQGRSMGLEVRTFSGGASMSNPIKPWVGNMVIDVYHNDEVAFWADYHRAVQAARESGLNGPGEAEESVLRSFQGQHPLKSAFATIPTEGQVQRLLNSVSDQSRGAVIGALSLFNHYLTAIKGRPTMGTTPKKPASSGRNSLPSAYSTSNLF